MIWLNDFGHLNSTIQAKQLYSLVVRQPLGPFAMEKMAHIIDDKMLAYHF